MSTSVLKTPAEVFAYLNQPKSPAVLPQRKHILICFGGEAYDNTTEIIVRDAPRFGVDKVLVYDDAWLMQQEFYRLNSWLWTHHGDMQNNPRGFGWFAWKPFIIMHALQHYCAEGDVLLYTDADTYPIFDLTPIYQECVRIGGTMLFAAQGCLHAHWCKRDTFVVMGQDADAYGGSLRSRQHAVARFMLFEKGPWRVWQFLMEWLAYCLNPLANTFDPSVILPEYPELREPRCEQAILTNLAHKYGHKLYREACQSGEHVADDKDLYPQLFIQDGNCGDKNQLKGSRFRNVL